MLSTFIAKTERSDTTNLQSSIVNFQFRLARVGIYDRESIEKGDGFVNLAKFRTTDMS
jgi:hypothetical protein